MHIPSEVCSFEGIPAEMKKNKMAMRDVFKHCLLSPEQRITQSVAAAEKLMASAELAKWGLSITAEPTQVDGKVLPAPTFGKTNAECNERALRSLAVENSADFSADNWAIAYST